MHALNPKVDGYVRKNSRWQEELQTLRTIILSCALTEEVKWRVPCYTFQKRNIVFLNAFKDSCALNFVKGALLQDPDGRLEKPGQHTQVGRRIRFTNARAIIDMKPVLTAFIQDAIEVEMAGVKAIVKKNPEPVPEELQRKFEDAPALKTAFETLTPGRQRAYILHFSAPKQSKTRESRIEKCVQKILNGKGLSD